MSARNWMTGMFTENGSYKLLSLALVIILYSWIMGERESTASAFASVRMNVPQDMVLTSDPVDRVRVTVRGRWSSTQEFQKTPMEPIVLDLQTKTLQDDIFRITPAMLKLSPSMKVVSIQPSFVRVKLEPKATKIVPIRARTIGEAPIGYVASKVEVSPSQVEIAGPRDVILRTRFILTDPVDLSDRSASFIEQVGLRHEDPNVLDTLQGPVRVNVNVVSRALEKTFDGVKVVAANTANVADISPKVVSVTLKGPQQVVERLDISNIIAYVDMSQVSGKGVFVKEVQIRNLPKGVELVQHNPTHFKVTLRAGSN